MTSENLIIDDSADKKFFTIIPNFVDDLPLNPNAVRVYLHLKRVSGETGTCWQSTRTLAKACRLSPPSITRATNLLAACGLITKKKVADREGGKWGHCEYRVRNIWNENTTFFTADADFRKMELAKIENRLRITLK